MSEKLSKDRRVFEIMLVLITVGMTFLLYKMGAYKMVVLNLLLPTHRAEWILPGPKQFRDTGPVLRDIRDHCHNGRRDGLRRL
jgi:hypothetical protein